MVVSVYGLTRAGRLMRLLTGKLNHRQNLHTISSLDPGQGSKVRPLPCQWETEQRPHARNVQVLKFHVYCRFRKVPHRAFEFMIAQLSCFYSFQGSFSLFCIVFVLRNLYGLRCYLSQQLSFLSFFYIQKQNKTKTPPPPPPTTTTFTTLCVLLVK